MTQKAIAEINRAILEEVFPIECDLVGTENLDDLCEGYEDFAESDQAFRMDVGESLAILANAVTVIAFVWTLLQERRKTELPPPQEIDEIVLRSVQESNALTGERRQAIYLTLTVKRNAQPH
jgi:hypothetical protein